MTGTPATSTTWAALRGSPVALSLRRVGCRYGKIDAVRDVSFDVAVGSRHAVIGPNGAGKSTLFGLIAGTIPLTGGSVWLGDRDVSTRPVHDRAVLGITQTFQTSSLFLDLSVLDNVVLAGQRRAGISFRMIRRTRERLVVETARGHLARVGLARREDDLVADLSHGERRQLEVAVSLATAPRVLLLDEPTAGMSPVETAGLVELVRSLPRSLTIVIVEHDLDVVFSLADRVSVMVTGRLLADGTPEEVRTSAEVQHAYLGAADDTDLFLETE
ncbi:ABC transporter ATP-binding protein [Pseudonocardia kunmingensis]|uniref:Amino acid/amide ABC transporter ATP-binding protein 1 (HAAT family) n=1 Tax=Pseudonocardia kunmingensis TaxID=630975 RepID=A0A543CX06_9PSEU|nr:ABC transporter ATP-binding protein [Pseudonocardia kunmingensis]TQM01630.1 amino acid/amide ABC transporter ATP-binding protein 1 (HAAT family) [Pseudonocardia kunmingensis]